MSPRSRPDDVAGANGGGPALGVGQIDASAGLLSLMADSLPALISYIGADHRYQFANAAHERWVGFPRAEIRGQHLRDVLGQATYGDIRPHLETALSGRKVEFERESRWPDGKDRCTRVLYSPHVEDGRVVGLFALALDITEHRRWERLYKGEAKVLEQLAAGESLPAVLTALVRMTEDQSEGMLGSILLLEDNRYLREGAAPNLPREVSDVVDGLAIGPNVGACGTAAYLGQRVVVEDVMVDPRFVEFRDLCKRHGLRACWSQPVLASDGRVLGTFASYYRVPRRPDPGEIQLLESAAHLAGLAIERSNVERALRREQYLLQTLMDNVPDPIYFKDLDSKFTRVNRAQARFLGVATPEEAVGRCDADFYEATSAGEFRVDELSVMRTGVPIVGKVEDASRGEAAPRWVSTTKVPMWGSDGRIAGIVGVARDVTEQKLLENRLRKTGEDVERRVRERTAELSRALEELRRETAERQAAEAARRQIDARYRSVVETALNVVICLDDANRVIEWSGAAEQIYGYARDEVLGRDYLATFVPVDSRDAVRADIRRSLSGATTQNFESPVRSRDGVKHTLLWNVTPLPGDDGRPAGVIAIGQDITKRKEAEEAVRENEERFRQLAEHIHEVFWLTTVPDKQVIYVSPVYEKIWARSAEQLYANIHDWLDSVHPDDREQVEKAFVERAPLGGFDEEYRIDRPDGTMRWIRDRRFPIRDASGDVYRIAGIAEDITERKRAEAILRESEERYRLLVEGIKYVAWEFDYARRQFTFVSRHAETLLGFSREEWQRPFFWVDRIHPDDREWALEFSREHCSRGVDHEFEYRMIDKRGDTIWIKDITTIVSLEPTQLRGVYIDITDRRKAEEEARRHQARLAQVTHLSTIGVMAASLSHELNQPLQAIMNYARTCEDELRAKEPRRDLVLGDLGQVAVQAERAAEIMRRLRSFVRSEPPKPEPTDLNDVVREAVVLLDAAVSQADVTIRTVLASDLPQVVVDRSHVQHVLLNLARNGIEAMAVASPDARVLTLETLVNNGTVEICVRDSGPGLSTATADQVFEPFFTTKDTGMGLGLTLSRRIIEMHGGRLRAADGATPGASFTIELPCPLDPAGALDSVGSLGADDPTAEPPPVGDRAY